MTNGSADLGTGSNTLQLANTTNSVSATNVASVLGGTGDDTIVLIGSNASYVDGGGRSDVITGNTGPNEFVFDQNSAGNSSTLENFDNTKGDTVGLNTTSIYNVGGAGIADGVDIVAVADNTTLLATTLTNGTAGGFAYESDTGALYYNSTGDFSGGGTLIGTITTDGSTPWVYDPTAFVQV